MSAEEYKFCNKLFPYYANKLSFSEREMNLFLFGFLTSLVRYCREKQTRIFSYFISFPYIKDEII